jgi:hypothetical protein
VLLGAGGLQIEHRRPLRILTEGHWCERLNRNETGDVIGGMLRKKRQDESQNCSDGGGKGPGTKNGLGDAIPPSRRGRFGGASLTCRWSGGIDGAPPASLGHDIHPHTRSFKIPTPDQKQCNGSQAHAGLETTLSICDIEQVPGLPGHQKPGGGGRHSTRCPARPITTPRGSGFMTGGNASTAGLPRTIRTARRSRPRRWRPRTGWPSPRPYSGRSAASRAISYALMCELRSLMTEFYVAPVR